MKPNHLNAGWLLLLALATINYQLSTAHAQGTAFTYQGKLESGGSAANGIYDFRFAVYDLAGGGSQQGATFATNAVPVTNGCFIATLDFGNQFNGDARWLEIGVRANGSDAFTTLNPRQSLTPAPYAIYAPTAGTASVAASATAGSITSAALADNSVNSSKIVDNSVATTDLADNAVSAAKLASDAGSLSKVTAGTVTMNGDSPQLNSHDLLVKNDDKHGLGYYGGARLFGGVGVDGPVLYGFSGGGLGTKTYTASNLALVWNNLGNVGIGTTTPAATLDVNGTVQATEFVGDSSGLTGLWRTSGNAGTTPGAQFVGTTDNQPLEFKVNNQRVLRLEPNGASPNVIAGYSGNVVSNGVYGAVIGGGGNMNSPNRVGAIYATVVGGVHNTASGGGSTAMGSSTTASGLNSTAMGYSTAASGEDSTAMGFSTTALGFASTAMGGYTRASGFCATAMGAGAKAVHDGAFVWADSQGGDFSSTANDQVSFRCGGGVRFTSGGPASNQTVAWTPYSGSWTFSSDRNLKEGFTVLDGADILSKVAQLPITEWNYKGYPQRHVGPMAQDFHALFPLNESDTTLNDVDLHGVALAAIQGLNQKMESENAALRAENAQLAKRLESLEQLIRIRNSN